MPNIDPKQPNSKGKTIKDYLPMAARMLLGKENPKEGPVESAVEKEQ